MEESNYFSWIITCTTTTREWIPNYSGNFVKESGDNKWHTKIRVMVPYGNIFEQGYETKPTDRKISEYYKLRENPESTPVYSLKPAHLLPTEEVRRTSTETLGTHDDEDGSSSCLKRTRVTESVEEAMLGQVHNEFLLWGTCNKTLKVRYEVVHQEMDIRIADQILQPKESFRYLGSVIHRSGRIEHDVAHRIRSGKTMIDMIPNKVFRAELDVDSIIDKMREGRLRWFGHFKRRPQTAPVRRFEALLVEGSKRRVRPKLRWEDKLNLDMKELLLSEDMTSDRNTW
ncbi:hypothetical protein Tco_1306046 [Tanacetum coccineum]